jgi:hypothetical protein
MDASSDAAPVVFGRFSPAEHLRDTRWLHTATLLPNGKILIVGGVGRTDPATAEIYDPLFNPQPNWSVSDTGTLMASRSAHVAALLPDGKVLVAGGWHADFLASAELYDPASGTFAATGEMTEARENATATMLSNGKVLIVGGSNQTGRSRTAELYDPASGRFVATGSMTVERELHTATLLQNGKVLVTGGFSKTGTNATTELYDPTAGTFSPAGSMTTARENHTATLLVDGRVLIAGGGPWVTTYAAPRSAELYDPTAGTFTSTGKFVLPREGQTATLLLDGTVLMVGGVDNIPNYFDRAEVYDPTTGSFSTAGYTGNRRTQHSATLIAGGFVIVCGGNDGSAAGVAGCDIYGY